MTEGADTNAAPPASPAAEQPWERNRRARQAQIEAELEHGRQLAERYGRERPRSRFAVVGHAGAKGRR